jgi:hypothetical protein
VAVLRWLYFGETVVEGGALYGGEGDELGVVDGAVDNEVRLSLAAEVAQEEEVPFAVEMGVGALLEVDQIGVIGGDGQLHQTLIDTPIPQLVVLHFAQLPHHCFRPRLKVKLHPELPPSQGVLVYVEAAGVVPRHWQVIIEALYFQ